MENKISVLIYFLFISLILILLAIIFGIIKRKKGKLFKYYGMANAGFIMGLIGITILVLPIIIPSVTTTLRTINERQNIQLLAEQEFFDIADLASSEGNLSFMDDRLLYKMHLIQAIHSKE